MGPIQYLPPQEDFLSSIQGGLQVGANIAAMREQRAARERAQQQAAQYQADVQAAAANPTPQAFAQLTLKYPQHREAFGAVSKSMDEQQQRAALAEASAVGSALQGGRSDVAAKLLEDKIEVMRKGGEQTTVQEFLLEQIKTDPKNAYATVLNITSALPGGDKVLEGMGKIGDEQRKRGLAPYELSSAESKAKIDAAKAKYADSDALLDLEKRGWDIKKIKEDISINKENARIAAMNASFAKEGNALKKQELELKIQEARGALDEKVRNKAAEAETAVQGVQDSLNLLKSIKKDPALSGALGADAWRAGIAGTRERSVKSQLDQLTGSLAFAKLDSLKGATSDKDIAFLQSVATSLSDRYQNEDVAKAELKRVEEVLERADAGLRRKYGLPPRAADPEPAPADVISEADKILNRGRR